MPKPPPPEPLEPNKLNKWILPYPIYTICTKFFPELECNIFVVAGGGGKSKTGVPNAFVSFSIKLDLFLTLTTKDIFKASSKQLSLEHLHHEDTGKNIIYSSAFHPSLPIVAISQQNMCNLYKLQINKEGENVINLKLLQSFQTDFVEDNESVQVHKKK